MQVQNLSLKLGRRQILAGIDFEIGTRGVLGLVGPNGSGKSSLMNVLSGNCRQYVGQVTFPEGSEGSPGLLPQSPEYPGQVTVEKFVEFSAWVATGQKVESPRMDLLLDSLTLSQVRDSKLKTLSGGTLRRVGLAGVLATAPHTLLLDEPTTGIDAVERVKLREVIAKEGRERLVVMSSHVAEDIFQLADRVLILDRGCQIFFGQIEELSESGGSAEFERRLIGLVGR